MDLSSTFTLSNGVCMPKMGLGVWRAQGEETAEAVSFALQHGYRLVDTAALYGNEAGVGAGVRASGVPRDEVFVTSKVWIDSMGYDNVLRSFDESMKRLQFDTLDMFMLHWPVQALWEESWRALEHLYREGRVRAIAVSNFPARVLHEMRLRVEVMPVVNQLEFHPLYTRNDIREACTQLGVIPQAWAPLGRGSAGQLERVVSLAKKYNKTPEQVVLRWDLQMGVSTIPKSAQPARIIQNADIFDFELTSDEVQDILAQDAGESKSPPPAGVML